MCKSATQSVRYEQEKRSRSDSVIEEGIMGEMSYLREKDKSKAREN